MTDNEPGRPGEPAPEGGGAGAAIVALVADLMFTARIRSVAPEAATVQSVPKLLEVVGSGTRLILVDLQARDPLEAIRQARERSAARLVAWGPHVMEAQLEAAREAGAEVMVRGQFVQRLPELVRDAR